MKKLLLVIGLLLLIVSGCTQNEERPETIITEIEGATSIDMSAYDNMDAHDHVFLEVKATDLLNLVSDGGSGIFFLGYPNCYACNVLISLIDEAAKEVGVNVYYINVDDPASAFSSHYDQIVELLYDYLNEYDGQKQVATPHVFTVIDGQIADSQISAVDGFDGTDATAGLMIDRYKEMFEAMVK